MGLGNIQGVREVQKAIHSLAAAFSTSWHFQTPYKGNATLGVISIQAYPANLEGGSSRTHLPTLTWFKQALDCYLTYAVFALPFSWSLPHLTWGHDDHLKNTEKVWKGKAETSHSTPCKHCEYHKLYGRRTQCSTSSGSKANGHGWLDLPKPFVNRLAFTKAVFKLLLGSDPGNQFPGFGVMKSVPLQGFISIQFASNYLFKTWEGVLQKARNMIKGLEGMTQKERLWDLVTHTQPWRLDNKRAL